MDKRFVLVVLFSFSTFQSSRAHETLIRTIRQVNPGRFYGEYEVLGDAPGTFAAPTRNPGKASLFLDDDQPFRAPGNRGRGNFVPPGLSNHGPPGLNRVPPGQTRHNNPGNGAKNFACRPGEFYCQSGECLPERLRCDNKYDCRDSSDEAECIVPSGGFTPSEFKENETGCVLPQQPDGGIYKLGGCGLFCSKKPGDMVPRNSILTYTCLKGYVLKGNTISACLNDEWYQPPTCEKTCLPLESNSVDFECKLEGKVVACDEPISPGTTAFLKCKASYKLPVTNDPGYREIKCLSEGLWDRTVFRCLAECGTAVSHGSPLVVNGFNAKVGVFPWHVGIYESNAQGKFVQICGGTLIGESLVISAAHCFYDDALNQVRNASNFAIAAGKYYRTWDAQEDYAQTSLVKEIKVADRYIGISGNFAEDIALVKLTNSFSLSNLVRPICLDWDNVYEREQLQPGQMGKVVGWGKDNTGLSSETLQEINLPFVSYSQCVGNVPLDFRGFITSDKFCAGYVNGSTLCDGDSGGGLCFEKQGVWYLRGVVSVSPVKDGSCDYKNYVGFTFVSYFLHWIRDAYVMS